MHIKLCDSKKKLTKYSDLKIGDTFVYGGGIDSLHSAVICMRTESGSIAIGDLCVGAKISLCKDTNVMRVWIKNAELSLTE